VSDGTGLAEALLGLSGLKVLEVSEALDELVIEIETMTDLVRCRVSGEPHERMPVAIRDFPCFGRPARLIGRKRRWRCVDGDGEAKTWTETSVHISPRCCSLARPGLRPAARWARTPGRWPSWPRSWGCAGGQRWGR
jgi:hypothetical protein